MACSSSTTAEQAGDGCDRPTTAAKAPFHNACDGAVSLANGCFGTFHCGIEWDKPDKFRLIHRRLASRGRANGGVDWILTAIGTRQRRKRQNLPVVKLRHRMDRHHGELVARQRSGLVRTENIDAAGLIDGGQARRQHTLAGQSAGTDRRCEREH